MKPALGHEIDNPVNTIKMGQPVPNVELIDQDAVSFSLESLRGKVILLTFLYTKCPDVCPLLTVNMKQTQELLGNKFDRDVAFVTISFDPDDAPEVLQKYAAKHAADDSGWKFLTSQSEDEMRFIAEAYGIVYHREEDGAYTHNIVTYLIDKNLIVKKMYYGTFHDPKQLAKDISGLIIYPLNLILYLLSIPIGGTFIFVIILYMYKKKKADLGFNVRIKKSSPGFDNWETK